MSKVVFFKILGHLCSASLQVHLLTHGCMQPTVLTSQVLLTPQHLYSACKLSG